MAIAGAALDANPPRDCTSDRKDEVCGADVEAWGSVTETSQHWQGDSITGQDSGTSPRQQHFVETTPLIWQAYMTDQAVGP